MTENWRPVPGFEYYEVSDQGRVRSLPRMVTRVRHGKPYQSFHPELIHKGNPNQSGHVQVSLRTTDQRSRLLLVHRLVLSAFVGPCPDGMEGCHNNGNPADNRLDNLRWDTRSANQIDTVNHGKHKSTQKTECPRGHPYTAENTYVFSNTRNGRTVRSCRICSKNRCREYRARTKKNLNQLTNTEGELSA